eukprot:gene30551-30234_t
MFAVKPERKLFAAALDMAANLQLSPFNGDGDNIWGDETGMIPKRDCSAGFFWALYYSQRYAPVAEKAIRKHGAGHPYKPACSPGACEKVPWRPKAYSIDRCVWGRAEKDEACAAKHASCEKELDCPIGKPLTPPTKVPGTLWWFTRQFEHAVVHADLSNQSATRVTFTADC